MAKTLKFYSDAGHGWLAVKRKELVELGILDQVSSFSYQRGATVYLEEDRDMSLYVNGMKAKGFNFAFGNNGRFMFDSSPEDKIIRLSDGKYSDRSPIRSYDSFNKGV